MRTRRFRFDSGQREFGALALMVFSMVAFAMDVSYDASGELRLITNSVSRAPAIPGHPRSLVAPTAANAVFSVSATGTFPLSYQWQFNSNNIPRTTDTLLLTNLTPADFGAYRVIVSNPLGSVTSSNALLQLDSDRDGLADSWETNYFTSITNRSGFEDYDGDGVSDRDEFLEGTHPRFASSSVNPRLTIVSDRGEVFVTPNIPLFTNGQTVTLTGVPDPGLQFIGYLGTPYGGGPYYNLRTNPAQMRFGSGGMVGSQVVRAIFGLSITNSIDVTNGWRIDQAGWFGQTNVTHDGVDAVQSERIRGTEQAWLELTNVMSGEGTITFWWKVDTTPPSQLQFVRNNTPRSGAIGTNTDWQLRTYYLPAGTNIIRWIYDNNDNQVSEYNGLTYAPADAGWVDEVTFEFWTDPARDANSNGLADLWEYRHFDTLGVDPAADPDRDGVSNLDESLDRTDPTSNASLLPRLTVNASGGSVTRNPDLPKYTLGQTVQLQAAPYPENYFVIWDGAVSGTNTTNSVLMNRNQLVTAIFGLPLAVALDTPALTWTRGGSIGWYGQSNHSHDGLHAAQAGPIGFRQESWMETSVTGPGTLVYWWKASSATNVNFGRFFIDGAEQPERISGAVDWRPQSYYLTAGSHLLRWSYTNNTATVSLTNGVWVDQVAFSSGTIAPSIVTQPADVFVPQGSSAVFTVAATGTPPFSYQWFRNNVSLGAVGTSATLTLLNVSPSQAGSYTVEVQNSVQTTVSMPATLTVLPVPPVNDNFANRTPLTGADAVLGYTFGATKEPAEPDHAFAPGGRSVWWSWTAPASGNFDVKVAATNLSGLVAAVYSGNSVDALTELGSDIGTTTPTNGINRSLVDFTFAGVAGTSYAVAVDNSTSTSGFVTVAVTPGTTPVLGGFNFTSGGSFGFSFLAQPGADYEIQSSDDLIDWTTLDAGIVPANGLVTFSDSAAGSQSLRFYRVSFPP